MSGKGKKTQIPFDETKNNSWIGEEEANIWKERDLFSPDGMQDIHTSASLEEASQIQPSHAMKGKSIEVEDLVWLVIQTIAVDQQGSNFIDYLSGYEGSIGARPFEMGEEKRIALLRKGKGEDR